MEGAGGPEEGATNEGGGVKVTVDLDASGVPQQIQGVERQVENLGRSLSGLEGQMRTLSGAMQSTLGGGATQAAQQNLRGVATSTDAAAQSVSQAISRNLTEAKLTAMAEALGTMSAEGVARIQSQIAYQLQRMAEGALRTATEAFQKELDARAKALAAAGPATTEQLRARAEAENVEMGAYYGHEAAGTTEPTVRRRTGGGGGGGGRRAEFASAVAAAKGRTGYEDMDDETVLFVARGQGVSSGEAGRARLELSRRPHLQQQAQQEATAPAPTAEAAPAAGAPPPAATPPSTPPRQRGRRQAAVAPAQPTEPAETPQLTDVSRLVREAAARIPAGQDLSIDEQEQLLRRIYGGVEGGEAFLRRRISLGGEERGSTYLESLRRRYEAGQQMRDTGLSQAERSAAESTLLREQERARRFGTMLEGGGLEAAESEEQLAGPRSVSAQMRAAIEAAQARQAEAEARDPTQRFRRLFSEARYGEPYRYFEHGEPGTEQEGTAVRREIPATLPASFLTQVSRETMGGTEEQQRAAIQQLVEAYGRMGLRERLEAHEASTAHLTAFERSRPIRPRDQPFDYTDFLKSLRGGEREEIGEWRPYNPEFVEPGEDITFGHPAPQLSLLVQRGRAEGGTQSQLEYEREIALENESRRESLALSADATTRRRQLNTTNAAARSALAKQGIYSDEARLRLEAQLGQLSRLPAGLTRQQQMEQLGISSDTLTAITQYRERRPEILAREQEKPEEGVVGGTIGANLALARSIVSGQETPEIAAQFGPLPQETEATDEAERLFQAFSQEGGMFTREQRAGFQRLPEGQRRKAQLEAFLQTLTQRAEQLSGPAADQTQRLIRATQVLIEREQQEVASRGELADQAEQAAQAMPAGGGAAAQTPEEARLRELISTHLERAFANAPPRAGAPRAAGFNVPLPPEGAGEVTYPAGWATFRERQQQREDLASQLQAQQELLTTELGTPTSPAETLLGGAAAAAEASRQFLLGGTPGEAAPTAAARTRGRRQRPAGGTQAGGDAAAQATGIANDVIQGLIQGLTGGRGEVQAAAALLGQAIVEGLSRALQTQSPSKITFNIGRDVARGLADGIRAGIPDIQRAVDEVGRVTANAFEGQSQRRRTQRRAQGQQASQAEAAATEAEARDTSWGRITRELMPQLAQARGIEDPRTRAVARAAAIRQRLQVWEDTGATVPGFDTIEDLRGEYARQRERVRQLRPERPGPGMNWAVAMATVRQQEAANREREEAEAAERARLDAIQAGRDRRIAQPYTPGTPRWLLEQAMVPRTRTVDPNAVPLLGTPQPAGGAPGLLLPPTGLYLAPGARERAAAQAAAAAGPGLGTEEELFARYRAGTATEAETREIERRLNLPTTPTGPSPLVTPERGRILRPTPGGPPPPLYLPPGYEPRRAEPTPEQLAGVDVQRAADILAYQQRRAALPPVEVGGPAGPGFFGRVGRWLGTVGGAPPAGGVAAAAAAPAPATPAETPEQLRQRIVGAAQARNLFAGTIMAAQPAPPNLAPWEELRQVLEATTKSAADADTAFNDLRRDLGETAQAGRGARGRRRGGGGGGAPPGGGGGGGEEGEGEEGGGGGGFGAFARRGVQALGLGTPAGILRAGLALAGIPGGLFVAGAIIRDVERQIREVIEAEAALERQAALTNAVYGERGRMISEQARAYTALPGVAGTALEYGQAAQTFAPLVGRGAMRPEQVDQIIRQQIGPLAARTGVPVQELTTSLTSFAEGNTQALDKYTQSVTDANGRVKTLGVTSEELTQIWGRQASQARLLQVGVDAYNQSLQDAKGTSDELAMALTELGRAAELSRQNLGQALAPVATPIVRGITQLLEHPETILPQIGGTIAGAEAGFATGGPIGAVGGARAGGAGAQGFTDAIRQQVEGFQRLRSVGLTALPGGQYWDEQTHSIVDTTVATDRLAKADQDAKDAQDELNRSQEEAANQRALQDAYTASAGTVMHLADALSVLGQRRSQMQQIGTAALGPMFPNVMPSEDQLRAASSADVVSLAYGGIQARLATANIEAVRKHIADAVASHAPLVPSDPDLGQYQQSDIEDFDRRRAALEPLITEEKRTQVQVAQAGLQVAEAQAQVEQLGLAGQQIRLQYASQLAEIDKQRLAIAEELAPLQLQMADVQDQMTVAGRSNLDLENQLIRVRQQFAAPQMAAELAIAQTRLNYIRPQLSLEQALGQTRLSFIRPQLAAEMALNQARLAAIRPQLALEQAVTAARIAGLEPLERQQDLEMGITRAQTELRQIRARQILGTATAEEVGSIGALRQSARQQRLEQAANADLPALLAQQQEQLAQRPLTRFQLQQQQIQAPLQAAQQELGLQQQLATAPLQAALQELQQQEQLVLAPMQAQSQELQLQEQLMSGPIRLAQEEYQNNQKLILNDLEQQRRDIEDQMMPLMRNDRILASQEASINRAVQYAQDMISPLQAQAQINAINARLVQMEAEARLRMLQAQIYATEGQLEGTPQPGLPQPGQGVQPGQITAAQTAAQQAAADWLARGAQVPGQVDQATFLQQIQDLKTALTGGLGDLGAGVNRTAAGADRRGGALTSDEAQQLLTTPLPRQPRVAPITAVDATAANAGAVNVNLNNVNINNEDDMRRYAAEAAQAAGEAQYQKTYQATLNTLHRLAQGGTQRQTPAPAGQRR